MVHNGVKRALVLAAILTVSLISSVSAVDFQSRVQDWMQEPGGGIFHGWTRVEAVPPVPFSLDPVAPASVFGIGYLIRGDEDNLLGSVDGHKLVTRILMKDSTSGKERSGIMWHLNVDYTKTYTFEGFVADIDVPAKIVRLGIEKRTDDGTKTFTELARSKVFDVRMINFDMWMNLAVECSGYYYRVFLNDQLVIDYRDTSKRAVEGAIGFKAESVTRVAPDVIILPAFYDRFLAFQRIWPAVDGWSLNPGGILKYTAGQGVSTRLYRSFIAPTLKVRMRIPPPGPPETQESPFGLITVPTDVTSAGVVLGAGISGNPIQIGVGNSDYDAPLLFFRVKGTTIIGTLPNGAPLPMPAYNEWFDLEVKVKAYRVEPSYGPQTQVIEIYINGVQAPGITKQELYAEGWDNDGGGGGVLVPGAVGLLDSGGFAEFSSFYVEDSALPVHPGPFVLPEERCELSEHIYTIAYQDRCKLAVHTTEYSANQKTIGTRGPTYALHVEEIEVSSALAASSANWENFFRGSDLAVLDGVKYNSIAWLRVRSSMMSNTLPQLDALSDYTGAQGRLGDLPCRSNADIPTNTRAAPSDKVIAGLRYTFHTQVDKLQCSFSSFPVCTPTAQSKVQDPLCKFGKQHCTCAACVQNEAAQSVDSCFAGLKVKANPELKKMIANGARLQITRVQRDTNRVDLHSPNPNCKVYDGSEDVECTFPLNVGYPLVCVLNCPPRLQHVEVTLEVMLNGPKSTPGVDPILPDFRFGLFKTSTDFSKGWCQVGDEHIDIAARPNDSQFPVHNVPGLDEDYSCNQPSSPLDGNLLAANWDGFVCAKHGSPFFASETIPYTGDANNNHISGCAICSVGGEGRAYSAYIKDTPMQVGTISPSGAQDTCFVENTDGTSTCYALGYDSDGSASSSPCRVCTATGRVIETGHCEIDGKCFKSGDSLASITPDLPKFARGNCEICDPSQSATAFAYKKSTCRIDPAEEAINLPFEYPVCFDSGLLPSEEGIGCLRCTPDTEDTGAAVSGQLSIFEIYCYTRQEGCMLKDTGPSSGPRRCLECKPDETQLDLTPPLNDWCTVDDGEGSYVCIPLHEQAKVSVASDGRQLAFPCETCQPGRNKRVFSPAENVCRLANDISPPGSVSSFYPFDPNTLSHSPPPGFITPDYKCLVPDQLDPVNPCRKCNPGSKWEVLTGSLDPIDRNTGECSIDCDNENVHCRHGQCSREFNTAADWAPSGTDHTDTKLAAQYFEVKHEEGVYLRRVKVKKIASPRGRVYIEVARFDDGRNEPYTLTRRYVEAADMTGGGDVVISLSRNGIYLPEGTRGAFYLYSEEGGIRAHMNSYGTSAATEALCFNAVTANRVDATYINGAFTILDNTRHLQWTGISTSRDLNAPRPMNAYYGHVHELCQPFLQDGTTIRARINPEADVTAFKLPPALGSTPDWRSLHQRAYVYTTGSVGGWRQPLVWRGLATPQTGSDLGFHGSPDAGTSVQLSRGRIRVPCNTATFAEVEYVSLMTGGSKQWVVDLSDYSVATAGEIRISVSIYGDNDHANIHKETNLLAQTHVQGRFGKFDLTSPATGFPVIMVRVRVAHAGESVCDPKGYHETGRFDFTVYSLTNGFREYQVSYLDGFWSRSRPLGRDGWSYYSSRTQSASAGDSVNSLGRYKQMFLDPTLLEPAYSYSQGASSPVRPWGGALVFPASASPESVLVAYALEPQQYSSFQDYTLTMQLSQAGSTLTVEVHRATEATFGLGGVLHSFQCGFPSCTSTFSSVGSAAENLLVFKVTNPANGNPGSVSYQLSSPRIFADAQVLIADYELPSPCEIGGQCIKFGTVNNECQVCDSQQSSTTWSINAGASCSTCDEGICRCDGDGACVKASEVVIGPPATGVSPPTLPPPNPAQQVPTFDVEVGGSTVTVATANTQPTSFFSNTFTLTATTESYDPATETLSVQGGLTFTVPADKAWTTKRTGFDNVNVPQDVMTTIRTHVLSGAPHAHTTVIHAPGGSLSTLTTTFDLPSTYQVTLISGVRHSISSGVITVDENGSQLHLQLFGKLTADQFLGDGFQTVLHLRNITTADPTLLIEPQAGNSISFGDLLTALGQDADIGGFTDILSFGKLVSLDSFEINFERWTLTTNAAIDALTKLNVVPQVLTLQKITFGVEMPVANVAAVVTARLQVNGVVRIFDSLQRASLTIEGDSWFITLKQDKDDRIPYSKVANVLLFPGRLPSLIKDFLDDFMIQDLDLRALLGYASQGDDSIAKYSGFARTYPTLVPLRQPANMSVFLDPGGGPSIVAGIRFDPYDAQKLILGYLCYMVKLCESPNIDIPDFFKFPIPFGSATLIDADGEDKSNEDVAATPSMDLWFTDDKWRIGELDPAISGPLLTGHDQSNVQPPSTLFAGLSFVTSLVFDSPDCTGLCDILGQAIPCLKTSPTRVQGGITLEENPSFSILGDLPPACAINFPIREGKINNTKFSLSVSKTETGYSIGGRITADFSYRLDSKNILFFNLDFRAGLVEGQKVVDIYGQQLAFVYEPFGLPRILLGNARFEQRIIDGVPLPGGYGAYIAIGPNCVSPRGKVTSRCIHGEGHYGWTDENERLNLARDPWVFVNTTRITTNQLLRSLLGDDFPLPPDFIGNFPLTSKVLVYGTAHPRTSDSQNLPSYIEGLGETRTIPGGFYAMASVKGMWQLPDARLVIKVPFPAALSAKLHGDLVPAEVIASDFENGLSVLVEVQVADAISLWAGVLVISDAVDNTAGPSLAFEGFWKPAQERVELQGYLGGKVVFLGFWEASVEATVGSKQISVKIEKPWYGLRTTLRITINLADRIGGLASPANDGKFSLELHMTDFVNIIGKAINDRIEQFLSAESAIQVVDDVLADLPAALRSVLRVMKNLLLPIVQKIFTALANNMILNFRSAIMAGAYSAQTGLSSFNFMINCGGIICDAFGNTIAIPVAFPKAGPVPNVNVIGTRLAPKALEIMYKSVTFRKYAGPPKCKPGYESVTGVFTPGTPLAALDLLCIKKCPSGQKRVGIFCVPIPNFGCRSDEHDRIAYCVSKVFDCELPHPCWGCRSFSISCLNPTEYACCHGGYRQNGPICVKGQVRDKLSIALAAIDFKQFTRPAVVVPDYCPPGNELFLIANQYPICLSICPEGQIAYQFYCFDPEHLKVFLEGIKADLADLLGLDVGGPNGVANFLENIDIMGSINGLITNIHMAAAFLRGEILGEINDLKASISTEVLNKFAGGAECVANLF